MAERIPGAVPELPVANVDEAAAYFVEVLGFKLDWGNDEGGIAGISQDDCRLFLTNASFRKQDGSLGPVTIWLNLESRRAVDELYSRWQSRGARIVSEPEDKPWNLHEFSVADLDGNQFRVFYDFGWELQTVETNATPRTAEWSSL